jgi:hypothetical protein
VTGCITGKVALANVPATTITPILHVTSDTGTLQLLSRDPAMLPAGTWTATQPSKPGHERPNLVEVVS